MSMRKYFFGLAAVVAVTAAGSANAADLIVNGSFENPVVSGYTYPHALLDSWNYSGNAVLINVDNRGAWGAPSNVDGAQFAGLQTTSVLSQDFNVATNGAYTLSWMDAGRISTASGDQTYEVYLDGAQLGGTFATTSGTDFNDETLALGVLGLGPTHWRSLAPTPTAETTPPSSTRYQSRV